MGLQTHTWVGMGAGAGLEIATLGKPAPVAQVYGFLTNEIRWVPHVTRMTTNQHQHCLTTAPTTTTGLEMCLHLKPQVAPQPQPQPLTSITNES